MVQGFAYLLLIFAGMSRAAALAWPSSSWVTPLAALGDASWVLSALSLVAVVFGMGLTPNSRGLSWRQTWCRAVVYLTITLLATWHWVTYSMHVFGGVPSLLAWLAAALLALFLALQAGLALALAAHASRGRSSFHAALLWAGGWLLHEWVLTSWWTGFPWGESAMPWMAVAPHWPALLGSGVAGAMVAGLFAWITLANAGRQRRVWHRWVPVLVLGAVLVPVPSWVWDRTQAGATTSVAMLQTQVRQDEKFDEAAGFKPLLTWLGESLRRINADVVVWPETAIPFFSTDPRVAALHAQAVARMPKQQAWVVGLPWIELERPVRGSSVEQAPVNPDFGANYYNAVQWWHAGQQGLKDAPLYAKSHLVPFGEFVPPGFRWFVDAMRIPMSDFSRGQQDQPAIEWAGQRWASTICYEDLFGVELARRMLATPSVPTVWLNHSNLAWFGPGVAPYQHLQIARWRAAELGRPMVRATNTGMTAVVDHRGHVQDRLDPKARSVLQASVQGREGLTPYVRWVNLPWVWEGLLALAALFVVWGAVRNKR